MFTTFVEPLLNDINHPSSLQEGKPKIDTAAYEKKIDANMYKTSVRKEIDHHNRKYDSST